MDVTKVLPVLQTDILPTSLAIKIRTLLPLIKITALEWNFYSNMEVPNPPEFQWVI